MSSRSCRSAFRRCSFSICTSTCKQRQRVLCEFSTRMRRIEITNRAEYREAARTQSISFNWCSNRFAVPSGSRDLRCSFFRTQLRALLRSNSNISCGTVIICCAAVCMRARKRADYGWRALRRGGNPRATSTARSPALLELHSNFADLHPQLLPQRLSLSEVLLLKSSATRRNSSCSFASRSSSACFAIQWIYDILIKASVHQFGGERFVQLCLQWQQVRFEFELFVRERLHGELQLIQARVRLHRLSIHVLLRRERLYSLHTG